MITVQQLPAHPLRLAALAASPYSEAKGTGRENPPFAERKGARGMLTVQQLPAHPLRLASLAASPYAEAKGTGRENHGNHSPIMAIMVHPSGFPPSRE